MFKTVPSVFPPRRPASVVRCLLAVFLVITILYAFSHRNPTAASIFSPSNFDHELKVDPNMPIKERPAPPPLQEPLATKEQPLAAPPPEDTSSSPYDYNKRPSTEELIHKPSVDNDSHKLSGQDTSTGTKVDVVVDTKPDTKPDTIVDTKTDAKLDSPYDSSQGLSHGADSVSDNVVNEVAVAENPVDESPADSPNASTNTADPNDSHPIGRLIYDAQNIFAELVSKESRSIGAAAQAYRKRRGRHPPPGFDKWYKFAQEKDALIIEDFFDQIYDDLQPFWGMEPSTLRKESWDYEMTIHIRDGTARTTSDWFWTVIWLDLIKTIEHLLPDMDIALNAMDEPRLVVPWEDIDEYMKKAAKTIKLPKAKDVQSDHQKLPEPGKGDELTWTRPKKWEDTKPYWKLARRGCPPDSLARTADLQASFAEPPEINMTMADPHMMGGFVSNSTLSRDICHQPDLQGLEGVLIRPISTSTTAVLFPMFGGSKLGVNNEILLPAPMYWNEEERFTGGDDHGIPWPVKDAKAIWRGVATGGKNTADNWRGFQRHRFVAMNNGTKLSIAEQGDGDEPQNFALPEEGYNITAQAEGQLGEWVDEWADVGFIDLMCDQAAEDGSCNYTSPYFEELPSLRMVEQFDYKYVPDIDGNSFSGRYLGFLRSTSLTIKSTLFKEWHDSRLVPWKHFVPMDNRFGDYYGIMEYFVGFNGRDGHDDVAEKIANESKEWAEKVLRKEDMQVYTLRLLLEYARLLDDRRENLGWVEDVLADPSLEKAWTSWW